MQENVRTVTYSLINFLKVSIRTYLSDQESISDVSVKAAAVSLGLEDFPFWLLMLQAIFAPRLQKRNKTRSIAFGVWLLSISIVFVGSTRAVVWSCNLFILIACPFYYMNKLQFIHAFFGWEDLGSVQFLTVMDSAVR